MTILTAGCCCDPGDPPPILPVTCCLPGDTCTRTLSLQLCLDAGGTELPFPDCFQLPVGTCGTLYDACGDVPPSTYFGDLTIFRNLGGCTSIDPFIDCIEAGCCDMNATFILDQAGTFMSWGPLTSTLPGANPCFPYQGPNICNCEMGLLGGPFNGDCYTMHDNGNRVNCQSNGNEFVSSPIFEASTRVNYCYPQPTVEVVYAKPLHAGSPLGFYTFVGLRHNCTPTVHLSNLHGTFAASALTPPPSPSLPGPPEPLIDLEPGPAAPLDRILVSEPFDHPVLLGDRIGAKIGQLTGRQPCAGCKKFEAGLNLVDKWGRRLTGHAY